MGNKIFMGGFHLESNTSNPVMVEAGDFFTKRGEEVLEYFPEVAQLIRDAGFEPFPSLYAETTCVAGGVLSLEAYRLYAQELIDSIPLDGSLSGIWLYLHGSMQVEFIGSGEAFLVSAIRERVGPSVPISVALDFHGNISYTLTRVANLITGYRTAPHVDIPETLATAARLLLRAVQEKQLPWVSMVKVPMLQPGEAATTNMPHVKKIIQELDSIQEMEGIWRTSYFTGMSWIDCPHNGSSVVVCGVTKDRAAVEKRMCDLAQHIWDVRYDFRLSNDSFPTEEAIDLAVNSPKQVVFLSDSGDNVTAGAVGDNAYMLKCFLERGEKGVLIAGLWDEEAVAAAAAAGVGSTICVSVGARHDAASTSVLLENALVKGIQYDAQGNAAGALLSVNGVDAAINSQRLSFTGEQDFINFGINYRDYHIIVVKLGYLYPGLSLIKDDSYIALTKGNAMLTIRYFQYHNQRRPLFPFEDNFPYDPAATLI